MSNPMSEGNAPHTQSIATLQDILEAHERRLVDAAHTGTDEELIDYVARLMSDAAMGRSPGTLDSVFEYVSVAHGLHAAARAVSDRHPGWAVELHEMGQLFLSYAVTDVGLVAAQTAAETMTMN